MIINKEYTFPRNFPVKLTQSETQTKYQIIFYGFCRINWKEGCTLLRHMAKTQAIEPNRYSRESIAIIQKKKKRDISNIPINNFAL